MERDMTRRSVHRAASVLSLLALVAAGACGSPTPAYEVPESAELGRTPLAIALDSDHVYATTAQKDASGAWMGFVQRVPKAGGPTELIAQAPSQTFDVTVDDARVYYTSLDGGPYAVDKSGGPTTLIGASGQECVGVTQDADSVYWTAWTLDQNKKPTSGDVLRAPKEGGAPVKLAADVGIPMRVVTDTTSVYWGNSLGEVWSVPKAGGDAKKLATAADKRADFVAVDDTYVYFTSGGLVQTDSSGNQTATYGSVNRVVKAGGELEVVIEFYDYPRGITLRGGKLYTGYYGGIIEAATDGSGYSVLEGTQSVGNDIDVDGSAIYWISDWGGVYRLAR
jgi:hypothetical protein